MLLYSIFTVRVVKLSIFTFKRLKCISPFTGIAGFKGYLSADVGLMRLTENSHLLIKYKHQNTLDKCLCQHGKVQAYQQRTIILTATKY